MRAIIRNTPKMAIQFLKRSLNEQNGQVEGAVGRINARTFQRSCRCMRALKDSYRHEVKSIAGATAAIE